MLNRTVLRSPDEPLGCGKPTGAVVGEKPDEEEGIKEMATEKGPDVPKIMIGTKAPDFKAPAYYKGGFTEVALSDYLGKWVVLCFYPGDFTFV
jgi:hypothetical protein